MKKTLTAAMALVVCVLLLAPALAETESGTVTVYGTATVSLMADTAVIQIGASTKADSVVLAQQKNDLTMRGVIEAILAQGVEKEDIVTSQYNLQANAGEGLMGYATDLLDSRYEVSNILSVTVRDLSRIGALIDATSAAGANTVYGLSFSSSKSTEAYHRALARAVEDGKAKAGVLAAAAGKELDELRSMQSDMYYGGSYGVLNSMDMMASEAKGAAIVSGDVSVTAGVTLVYSFR